MAAVASFYSEGNEIEVPSLEDLIPPVAQSGKASWYGSGINNDNGMHGRYTATGEVFDPSLKTCASRSIPLNTIVFIEIKRTGRLGICRVNDRGPYGAITEDGWVLKTHRDQPGKWRGVMDLSKGTAKQLGFDFRAGLEEINIRWYK